MLAIDADGVFYPCTRFTPFSLAHKQSRSIGSIGEGINANRLRPFFSLDVLSQSTLECIDCEISAGCAWCPGYNYDVSEYDTIFHRATALCKMHKARVKANNYFWALMDNVREVQ